MTERVSTVVVVDCEKCGRSEVRRIDEANTQPCWWCRHGIVLQRRVDRSATIRPGSP